jgi:hypothetical protein
MQDLPYFKAFPSDWEQAMRRADIPPEDRGEVYRLIFFAWADGGLLWDDEKAMRRYAREMGWQWRRFSRTLEHYKRLCSPQSEYRLPVFLLRNLRQSLPEVSPKFDQGLGDVSPGFTSGFTGVSPKFDAEIAPKSNDHGETHDKSESRVQSQNSKTEEMVSRAPARSTRRPNICDEEYLEELQKNPAYAVFDVKEIFHKMAAWCRVKGKKPTRARLVNWLNREDKPLSAPLKNQRNSTVGASSPESAGPPSPPKPRTGKWGHALTLLDAMIGADNVIGWIEPLTFLGVENAKVRFSAPAPVYQDWIERYYSTQLSDALREAGLGDRFEILAGGIDGKSGISTGAPTAAAK